MSDSYQFVFTAVRNRHTIDGVQLSEIELYDANGVKVSISGASNPGGEPGNIWEEASSVVDGSVQTKWYDASFHKNGNATLILQLSTPTEVTSYQLYTATKPDRRDPVSWSFGILHGSTYEVLSTVRGTVPVLNRRVPYQAVVFSAYMSPPPSPTRPPPSPAMPPRVRTSRSPTLASIHWPRSSSRRRSLSGSAG